MKMNKNLIFLVGIPLVVASAVLGARAIRESAGTRIPLLVCPEMLDLGERERGEIVLCRFHVQNSGRAKLTLEQFQTSCSCTGVERIVDGRSVGVRSVELGPKQSLELTVRMAVGAPQGEPQVVYLHFHTNDPTRPIHQVQIVVPRVRGSVYALPKAVVFGPVRVGEQVVRVVDLYDTGLTGRRVAAARSKQPERFDVRFAPPDRAEVPVFHSSAGNLIGRLEVTARANRPGPLDGDIEIILANEARSPDIIRVVGDALPRVDYWPRRLFLPRRIANNYVHEGEILIASADAKAIQVTVESLPEQVAAFTQPVPGRDDQTVLVVKVNAAMRPAPWSTEDIRIRVRIRSGSGDVVEDIPVVIGEVPS